MTALTDRYVWAVLRAVPASQRADLEPEVRALVADAIDARNGDPSLSGEAAERAALTELGDPAVLAARYADSPQYLIGPRWFAEWRRLLTMLLPIVVPIVSIVVLAANLLSGAAVGAALISALGTGITVTIQMLFWFTLVFALLERFGDQELSTGTPAAWTVDALPELPDDGRLGIFEVASTVIANVLVIGGILWVQLQPPIVLDGQAFALFDPALWSFWLPYFVAVSVLEIAFAIALYMRGRWTMTFAIGNALLGAAFAVPAVWLLQNDLLFNPALVAKVTAATDGTWLGVTGVIIGVSVVAIVAWDAIDGFRKAIAASRR
jgi:hypothetical protein